MKASISNIAEAIYESSAGHSDPGKISRNALEFIVRNNLLGKSGAILEKLEEIVDQNEGVVRAKVTTKDKMTQGESSDLKKMLADRYKAKTIELTEAIDDSLLGGVKVEVGDEVIDLSLKNKLTKLENYLKNS